MEADNIHDPEAEALEIMRGIYASESTSNAVWAFMGGYDMDDAMNDPEYWKLLAKLKKLKSQAGEGQCDSSIQSCPYANSKPNIPCNVATAQIQKLNKSKFRQSFNLSQDTDPKLEIQMIGDFDFTRIGKNALSPFIADLSQSEFQKMFVISNRNKLKIDLGGTVGPCRDHKEHVFAYDKSSWSKVQQYYPEQTVFRNQIISESDTSLEIYPSRTLLANPLRYMWPYFLEPDSHTFHINTCNNKWSPLKILVFPNAQINYNFSISLYQKSYAHNFDKSSADQRQKQINKIDNEIAKIEERLAQEGPLEKVGAVRQPVIEKMKQEIGFKKEQKRKITTIDEKVNQFNESKQKAEDVNTIKPEDKAANQKKIDELKSIVNANESKHKVALATANRELKGQRLRKKKQELRAIYGSEDEKKEIAQREKNIAEIEEEIKRLQNEIVELDKEIGKPIDANLERDPNFPNMIVETDTVVNSNANNSNVAELVSVDKGPGVTVSAKLALDGHELSFVKKIEQGPIKKVSKLLVGLDEFQKIISKISKSASVNFAFPNITFGLSGGWSEVNESFKCGYNYQLVMGCNPLFGVTLEVDLLGAALLATLPTLAKLKDWLEDIKLGKVKLVLGISGSISAVIIINETLAYRGGTIAPTVGMEKLGPLKSETKISFTVRGDVAFGVEKKFIVQGSLGATAAFTGTIAGPHESGNKKVIDFVFDFDGVIVSAILTATIGNPETISYTTGAPFEPIEILARKPNIGRGTIEL
ncbi:MAG: hypothetical protein ACK478_01120 [Flavobacteriales bacterium]